MCMHMYVHVCLRSVRALRLTAACAMQCPWMEDEIKAVDPPTHRAADVLGMNFAARGWVECRVRALNPPSGVGPRRGENE